MSDLFHDEVPDSFIHQVFAVMRNADWHQYQVLTKRSERLLELSSELDWAPQVWMGVSVENKDYAYRIEHLRKTKAKGKRLVNRRRGWSRICGIGRLLKLELGKAWASSCGEAIH
jgi:protein gp37